MTERPKKTAGPKSPRCPICKEPAQAEYRPFCSRRCADIDLGRWMTGSYAVPAQEEEPDESDRAAAGRDPEGRA